MQKCRLTRPDIRGIPRDVQATFEVKMRPGSKIMYPSLDRKDDWQAHHVDNVQWVCRGSLPPYPPLACSRKQQVLSS